MYGKRGGGVNGACGCKLFTWWDTSVKEAHAHGGVN